MTDAADPPPDAESDPESAPDRDSVPDRRRHVLRLGLFAAVLAVLFYLAAIQRVIDFDAVRAGIQSTGAFAPLVYVGVSSVLGALLVPGPLLAAGSGFLFGPALGTVVTLGATVGSAMLTAFAGRRAGRSSARALLGPRRTKRIDRVVDRGGLWAVVGQRFVPGINDALASYTFGAFGVPLWQMAAGAVIGSAPKAFAYSALGSTVGSFSAPLLIAAVAVYVVTAVAGAFAAPPRLARVARPMIVLTDEFRSALDHLVSGRNMFLTGKAGTGKSTLIRRFMADTDRSVVVVAPTGIAALNVDGYTIHRFFGFRPTTTLEDIRGGEYRPGRFTKTLGSLQTLIIDEASMVRADVFDMLAAALERFGRAPGTPFGGVQIVLVGDLYQLPPVVGEHEGALFATVYETPYFFSARRFRREDFPTVSLTTVFRQLGDDRMTAILNEISRGCPCSVMRRNCSTRVPTATSSRPTTSCG